MTTHRWLGKTLVCPNRHCGGTLKVDRQHHPKQAFFCKCGNQLSPSLVADYEDSISNHTKFKERYLTKNKPEPANYKIWFKGDENYEFILEQRGPLEAARTAQAKRIREGKDFELSGRYQLIEPQFRERRPHWPAREDGVSGR